MGTTTNSCRCSDINQAKIDLEKMENELQLWEKDLETLEDMKSGIEESNTLSEEISGFLTDMSGSAVSAFSPNNIGDVQTELSEFNKDTEDLIKTLSENYGVKNDEVIDKIDEIKGNIKNLKIKKEEYTKEDEAFHSKEDEDEDDEEEEDNKD